MLSTVIPNRHPNVHFSSQGIQPGSQVVPAGNRFNNPAPKRMPGPFCMPNEPLADAFYSPTGTSESAMGLDMDGKGNFWRMSLNGWEKVGAINPQGQYWFQNGQQGDFFETRNPQREGVLDLSLENEPHPMVQALRARERQRAQLGSEIPRLRALFNSWGLTGQGVKVGILDPYEPLELEGVDLKTEKGDPGQAWSLGDHSKAISDLINDRTWGLAPGTIVVDKGFVPKEDETLREDDDLSAVQYNMTKTACNLFDDTTKQLNQVVQQKTPGLRVLSITWGGSFITTLDNLKEVLNEKEENGEYSYPNVRRQMLGPALTQGPREQEQAMLNFIASVFQQPVVQQAHQRYIEATRQAASSGQIIVAACGNEHAQNAASLNLPPCAEYDQLAQSPYVISVAASDTHQTPGNRADDSIAYFSSWGDGAQFNPTIAAPGQGIFIGNQYKTMNGNHVESGTSFAVPLVCGTVALMLQANPLLNFDQVRTILQRTATPLPGYPVAAQGAGVINPELAVQMAINSKRNPVSYPAAYMPA